MHRVAALIVVVSALAACGDASNVPAPATRADAAPAERPEESPATAVVDRVLETHECGDVSEREKGAGTGTLRLRIAYDGSPAAMYVRLWRLGVAESDDFTAGDQIQARLKVSVEGAAIDRLPAGRYRVEVPDQRLAAVDPPEFLVGAGVAEKTLDVQPRAKHRVRLLLFDETGASIHHATGTFDHDDGVPYGPAVPPRWASPRISKPPPEDVACPAKPSSCFPPLNPTLPPIDAGPDGFDLGTLAEWGRYERQTVTADVRIKGCNRVIVAGDGDLSCDVSAVAVCVPESVLLSRVEMPDGTPMDSRGATVFAGCRTRRFAWNPPAEAWRTVPVHVWVTKGGFEDLRFEWTVETADDRHMLVPAKEK